MVDMMYELPDEPKGNKYVITKDIVEKKSGLLSTKQKKTKPA